MKTYNRQITLNFIKLFCKACCDLFLPIYVVLILLSYRYGYQYKTLGGLLIFAALLNVFLNYKLKKRMFNVSVNSIVLFFLLTFTITYYILIYSKNLSAISASINVFAIFSVLGVMNTNLKFAEYLGSKSNKKSEFKEVVRLITCDDFAALLNVKQISVCTACDSWSERNDNNKDIYDIITQFSDISFKNNYGRSLIKSFSPDEFGEMELYVVKAKAKYQVIIRGDILKISHYCSNVIIENKLCDFKDKHTELAKQIGAVTDSGDEAVCCAFREYDSIEDISADNLNNFIFMGYVVRHTDIDINNSIPLVICECENSKAVEQVLFNKDFEYIITKNDVKSEISELHKKEKKVLGKYKQCDFCDEKKLEANSIISLKINEGYASVIKYHYHILVMILFFTMVLFTAIFKTLLFTGFEIICLGYICLISCTISVFGRKFCDLGKKKWYTYVLIFISSISIMISYIMGRYLFKNAEYSGDIFYYYTGRSMAFVTALILIILNLFIITKSDNDKNLIKRFTPILILIPFVLIMLNPKTIKIFEVYSLSNFYVVCSMVVALITYFIIKLIGIFCIHVQKPEMR